MKPYLFLLLFALMRSVMAEPFHYYLQTGVFAVEADAVAHSAQLQAKKFPSISALAERARRAIYRVRIGPFKSKEVSDDIMPDSNRLALMPC